MVGVPGHVADGPDRVSTFKKQMRSAAKLPFYVWRSLVHDIAPGLRPHHPAPSRALAGWHGHGELLLRGPPRNTWACPTPKGRAAEGLIAYKIAAPRPPNLARPPPGRPRPARRTQPPAYASTGNKSKFDLSLDPERARGIPRRKTCRPTSTKKRILPQCAAPKKQLPDAKDQITDGDLAGLERRAKGPGAVQKQVCGCVIVLEAGIHSSL